MQTRLEDLMNKSTSIDIHDLRPLPLNGSGLEFNGQKKFTLKAREQRVINDWALGYLDSLAVQKKEKRTYVITYQLNIL